ncbi:hypothetical protein [Enterococcus gilvus]|uniref:RNA helicase n=1 Tax=Enterococcus gilvus ATCC BAA-350 TaxID=1158614 RepID=R2VIG0_9ENTE|nr:hypothetical protein [Enterococcus gilvus]EOI57411.1 hypothetical protein UKC_01627 [Enterococcus gilvus ATCC BAA-350]EOW83015.1 hypothetical protein I592_02340 [Enterococcus gilvus ATCC BAA-350]
MSKKEKADTLEQSKEIEIINCGLIMPIAPMPGYTSNQFNDVKSILVDAIESIKDYNFKPRLVSDSKGEVDIIHKSIVNNIYDDQIVVVDISGKNGNVMLELGLRLAFDKPLVIIKDDKTDYMFDISMIEHINYPSDLRHNEIEIFKKKLVEKVVKTYKKSIDDSKYSPFLQHFQHIKVKGIGEQNIEQSQMLEIILAKISHIEDRTILQDKNLHDKVRINRNSVNFSTSPEPISKSEIIKHFTIGWDPSEIPNSIKDMKENETKYIRFISEINKIVFANAIHITDRMMASLLVEIKNSIL